jgi:hypothetical protein
VQFEDPTLAETAQDGFADLDRVRPTRLSEQQAFRDRTDSDCHNAMVDELTKVGLARADPCGSRYPERQEWDPHRGDRIGRLRA